jgi:4-amino-4-deoxy-L-arabinose transferase-like glycosyltransferase
MASDPVPPVERASWTIAFGLLLVGLGVFRFVRLDGLFERGWDEGAYLMAARLMARGFSLYRDIYMPQLPGFLWMLASLFRLGGDSVVAARALVVVLGMVAIAAAGLAARQLSSPAAAIVAVLMLGLDPLFFSFSRAVYLEVPATAFGMLSLACALAFRRSPRRAWLAAAALLWSLSVLTKPFLLGLGVPLLLCPWMARGEAHGHDSRALRRAVALDFLAVAAVALAPLLLLLATTDIRELARQFLGVNARLMPHDFVAVALASWKSLRRNDGLLALAALGTLVGGRWSWALLGGVVVEWLLVLRVPPGEHHLVVLVPPLAVLAGIGAGACWADAAALVSRDTKRRRPSLPRIAASVAALVVVTTDFGALLRRLETEMAVDSTPCASAMVDFVAAHSEPSGFVISDEPMVVYRAGRAMPPAVVVVGGWDILAGAVDAWQISRAAETHDVRLVLVSSRFRDIPESVRWVRAHYFAAFRCPYEGGAAMTAYVSPIPVNAAAGAP